MSVCVNDASHPHAAAEGQAIHVWLVTGQRASGTKAYKNSFKLIAIVNL